MEKGQKPTFGWRALSVGALGLLTCSLSLVACGGSDSSGDDSGTGGSATGTGGSSTGTGGSASGTGGDTATGGSAAGTGGSTGSGGSSSSDVTYACMLPGEGDYSTCLQYTGSETYIDSIRDASNCVDQGGTEPDVCPTEGAGICAISHEGLPTTNSTYYYGLTADDVESYTAICEAAQGTFTPPAP